MAKKKKSSKKKTAKVTKKSKGKAKAKKLVAKSVKKSTKKATKKLSKKKTSKKVAAKKAAPKKTAAKKSTKKVVAKKAATSAKKIAAPKTVAKTTEAAAAPVSTAKLGEQVPPLSLETTEGSTVNLSDLASQNRHLVLYFYPKDDTPGCTKEACDFRDNIASISERGATVVGVSPDSKESHQNFATKYGINFTLLADTNHELAEKMGVWKNKQFMGNSYMGVERSTFLFTDGKLSQIWSPVKVDGHVTEIIEALEEPKA